MFNLWHLGSIVRHIISSKVYHKPFHQVDLKLFKKKSCFTEFYADWLTSNWPTDWLTNWCLQTGVIWWWLQLQAWFLHCSQCCFIPRCAFLPTTVAAMIASWFYQNLALFSIPFTTAAKMTICISMLWFQCKTWVSAVLAGGISYIIFCLEWFEELGAKQSVVLHRGWATHPLFW